MLLLPVGLLIDSFYKTHLFHEQNFRVEDELIRKVTVLGNAIQKRFALLEGLYAFVLANPNPEQLEAKFSVFASALQTGTPGIRNFGLSPGGINAYVFPLKGNENAIGHSLIDDYRPNVKADVQRAIESQKITLSGPYQLRQGGLGLVARKAVFRGDHFWGLATMVIDMPPVLLEVGLKIPAEAESSVAIRITDGKSFYGSEQLFSSSSLVKQIILPDGSWQIAMRVPEYLLPPFARQLHLFRTLSSLVGLLLIALAYSISSRQTYLGAKVKEQTLHLEEELAERRKVEQALSESEQRFRELIESSPIGLALCAMDGSLISVNPAYAAIIGHSVEDVLKLSYWDITPERYAPQEKEQLEQLEATGRYGPYEKEYRHKDGHLVPVRLNGMIIVRDGEKRIWSSVEDISALKEAEAAQSVLAEQLRQSQKMEAIGTLAGGVAHDFNNILSAILGYTELTLRDPDCSPNSRLNLESVLSATKRATDLVKQILMFSRKEEGERTNLRIESIVLEASKLLRKTIPKTVSFRMDIDPPEGTVLADPTQIHQVVMNLCTNAFHALPKQVGEIAISVKQVQVDKATSVKYSKLSQGDYVMLTVADNGTGMPPKIMSRAFEPFFTTKKQGEGTGMGLAVVHGIIQSHGGDIGIESTVGKGTVIKVFLPLSQEDADHVEVQATKVEDLRGSERLLFVDDEILLVDLGRETLELFGYHVTAVTSAKEALNIFMLNPSAFDLIITDQTMPEISGDVLAEKILSVRPNIPIIICTGHSSVMDKGKAQSIGVKALLMKPVESTVLAREIRKILDKVQ